MSTTTAKLGLVKPATDEDVDITILNDNSDKVDAASGVAVCDSLTRPGSPFTGQTIFETDTKKIYIWDGDSWEDQLALRVALAMVLGSQAVTTEFLSEILSTRDNATDSALRTMVDGDADNRLDVLADGQMDWGDGSNPADLSLLREAAGVAQLAGQLHATGGVDSDDDIIVTGNVAVSGNVQCDGDLIPTGAGYMSYIRKSDATTIQSDTTVNDDPHIEFELGVGSYRVELFAHCVSAEAADVKSVWAFDGTATIARSCIGAAADLTNRENTNAVFRGNTYTTEQTYGIDATGSTVFYEDLVLEVTAAGTLNWRWAQASSVASDTTMSSATRAYITRFSSS